MGFFEAGEFDKQKEAIAKRGDGSKATFDWEGRFIATIDSCELGKSEKPGPNLGTARIMIKLTILEVIESENKGLEAGSEVMIYWGQQGYFGEKLLGLLSPLYGVPVSEVTEELANKFIDPENHTLDGVPCRFDRIRETYNNKAGEEKSYVPDGLTRKLTKKEAEKFELDKKILDLLD